MWQQIMNWICSNGYNCSGNEANGAGNVVPELSLTAGPLAITIIFVLIGIGIERSKQKKSKR